MTMAFKKALYFTPFTPLYSLYTLYSQITSQSTTTLLYLLQKEIRIALRGKKRLEIKFKQKTGF